MTTTVLSEQLLDRVRTEFYRIINEDDSGVGSLLREIRAGSSDFTLAHDYAVRIGDALERAIFSQVGADDLPSGRLTQELAEAVIGEPLRISDDMVNEVCALIQTNANAAAGIGIKAITPKPRLSAIEETVARVAELDEFSELGIRAIVDMPTWSLEVVDMFVRANMDFQNRAGFDWTITRTYEGPHFDPHIGKGGRGHQAGGYRDCKFCKDREYHGKYSECDTSEIFRRHKGCRCIILTEKPDGTLQSAWTRREGTDVKQIYRQERERLKKLDSMSRNARYEELAEKARERRKAK